MTSPYPRLMALDLSDRREYLHRLRKLASQLTGKQLEAAAHALLGEITMRKMETR